MPKYKKPDAWKAILKRLLTGPATTDELKVVAGQDAGQAHYMLWNHWVAGHLTSETGQLTDPKAAAYNAPNGPWALKPEWIAQAQKITAKA